MLVVERRTEKEDPAVQNRIGHEVRPTANLDGCRKAGG